jgi:peptidoglycan/LPS O-acetylase OafA/YrhL
MVRERSLRLLLPVVAGMLLIVPPQIYYERLAGGDWHGGYWSFMIQRVFQFVPYPTGDFSWHHLWFVVYLYVYVLLLLPLLIWWRRRAPTLRPGAWLLTLSLPLALNEALLKPLFPESHNLVNDWYVFNHYLLLTVYGFLLASMDGAWEWLAAQRRKTLLCTISILAIALPLLTAGVIQRDTPMDALIANVFTWMTLLAFIGYGRAHLSFENKLIRWARDASYPIYILHQTIIVATGYYVIQQPWAAGTKYWVVFIATVIASVASYQLVVRRFAATRVIFGMKRAIDKQADPPTSPTRLQRATVS